MPEKTGKNAADLFVECLEGEGVELVFGIPGEETLMLVEAIRNSGISLVLTRHEQAAAFMAATMGRLTGRAGVVLATLGPGAANLVTGVAHAQLGGMPLVVITGQKPVKKSKQGQFQIINVVEMMHPITKLSRQVPSADQVPSIVREAFRRAEEERPGAVHIELPEDIAAEPATVPVLDRIPARRPSPDRTAVELAARMIEDARSPLILIAAAANRKRVRCELDTLINKTGIPFFTTQMGKGVVDERCASYLGTAALTDHDQLHRAIDASDLIISVGHDTTEKPPAIMGHGRRRVIHVNFYSAVVDDVYFPTHEVIGDIAASIWEIGRAVKKTGHWDFGPFERNILGLRASISEFASDPSFPMKPQRLVCDLRAVMPDDGMLTLDNGMYKIWVARNYPAYEQNTVLLDNALATMGAGLPSAIAASLVYPGRKVVCVTGDGGFMMNSQEMETALRLGVSVTVVVLRDNGYGMIKWKQQAMGLAPFGLDFGNPDFVRYAESYGARGFRVGSADDFARILKECLDRGGVNLIDCAVDYSGNISDLGAAPAAQAAPTPPSAGN